MLLNELFGSPEEIKWEDFGPKQFQGYFNVGESKYKILARLFSTEGFKKQFGRYVNNDLVPKKTRDVLTRIFKLIDEKNIENYLTILFEDTEHGTEVTGKGNAAVVIGTVIDGLKQIQKKTGANIITFTGEGKGRQKLYNRLIKMVGGDMTISIPHHTTSIYIMVLD